MEEAEANIALASTRKSGPSSYSQGLAELLKSAPPWEADKRRPSDPALVTISNKHSVPLPPNVPPLGPPILPVDTENNETVAAPLKTSTKPDDVPVGPLANGMSTSRSMGSLSTMMGKAPIATSQRKNSLAENDQTRLVGNMSPEADQGTSAARTITRSATSDLADFLRSTSPPVIGPVEASEQSNLNGTVPTRPLPTSSTTGNLAETLSKTYLVKGSDGAPNVAPPSSSTRSSGRFRNMFAKVIGKRSSLSAGTDSATSSSLAPPVAVEATSVAAPAQAVADATRHGTTPPSNPGTVQAPLGDGSIDIDSSVNARSPHVHSVPMSRPNVALGVVDEEALGHEQSEPKLMTSNATEEVRMEKPKTMVKHQVLVFDPSLAANELTIESALTLQLKALLSPIYTVNMVGVRSLKSEPWQDACALLVVVASKDASDFRPDPILRSALTEYKQQGGSLLGLGSAAAMLCRDGLASDRQLVNDRALFPGTCVYANDGSVTLTPAQDIPTAFYSVIDGSQGSDSVRAILWDLKLALWTSFEMAGARQDLTLRKLLSLLGILDPSKVSMSTGSRWSSVDQKLLQPKHPLPGFILAHPRCYQDGVKRAIFSQAMSSKLQGTTRQMDRKDIPLQSLQDACNTFDLVDLETADIDVCAYLESQRQAVQGESEHQLPIPLLLTQMTGRASWIREWTPLFDFDLYWRELDRISKTQGVPRSPGPQGWRIGDLVQYGEAVGSTQTMLDR